MLPIYYACTVLFAFITMVYCVEKGFFRNIFFTLASACILLSNTGFLAVSVSKTVEEACLAYKLSYTGSIFLPLYLLLGIASICNIKFPRFIPILMLIVSCGILTAIYSIGYCDVYYKSVELVQKNGASYLLREYGPLHKMMLIYLAVVTVVMLVLIVLSFRRGGEISYKYAISLLMIVLGNSITYFVERWLKSDVEILSFTFILSEILAFQFLLRRNLFGVDSVAQRTFGEGKEAFFILDKSGHFMGRSPAAVQILPELSDLKLEIDIPEKSRFLSEKVNQLLNPSNEDPVKDSIFFRNGREYRLSSRALYGLGKKKNDIIGTVILLQDDTKQQRYIRLMSYHNEELAKDVEQKTDHIRVMHNKLIFGMADMVESRDPNTGGHIKRTSGVVKLLTTKLLSVKNLNLTEEFLRDVAKAAPMHDLGKISIDDAILRKPGLFTREEYESMKKHASKGAEIVSQIVDKEDDENFFRIAVNVAHYHHEKWDGTGYPDNLEGEEIPVEARIMALADVFDALVSKRCYKEAFSFEKAFEIIEESLGTQFSPEFGRVFLECKDELVEFYANALAEG